MQAKIVQDNTSIMTTQACQADHEHGLVILNSKSLLAFPRVKISALRINPPFSRTTLFLPHFCLS